MQQVWPNGLRDATATAGGAAVPDRQLGEFQRVVRDATHDLHRPRPWLYWTDLLASAAIGYVSFAVAVFASDPWWTLLSGVVAVFALYRAAMFIHELTHLRPGAVPGLWVVWNAVVGIPLMVPSFMYEDVHRLHHATSHYGTAGDPEYLPLARSGLLHVAGLLAASLAVPVLLLLRSAVIAPLAAVVPWVRRIMVERMSSLTINPDFRRAPPPARMIRSWIALEAAAAVSVWTLIALLIGGVLPLSALLVWMAVGAGVSFVNQARTVVAHRWESDGRATDIVGQLLDTVSVPPPALLPVLWAPLGLRYHGLHHLVPALPYHNLGEAHRRLMASAASRPYQGSLSRSGIAALRRLAAGRAVPPHGVPT